jgi:hypothetical protein
MDSGDISFQTLMVSFFTWVGAAVYTYGTVAMLIRLVRERPSTVLQNELKVTCLKPMAGLDANLRENLQTFADLKAAPEFEVILCLGHEKDAALPLARQFEAQYPQRFRVKVGRNPHLGNAKMAQLAVGLPLAKNDLIWVSEANVETSQNFLEALVGTWKAVNAVERVPTLVHAPLVAVEGSGIGASFERSHLASFHNPNAELAALIKENIVVGKTEFFHRDDLRAVGGLESFGDYLGEDYMLGQAFAKLGVVRRIPLATRNVLGHVTFSSWFNRHVRWAVIRKSVKPFEFFVFELLSYSAVPMLLFLAGLVPWSVLAFLLVHRAGIDAIAYATLSRQTPRVQDVLLSPFKEVALFAAWVVGSTTNHVKWKDRAIHVGPKSAVLTLDAEPSKFKRHLNTFRGLFDRNSTGA